MRNKTDVKARIITAAKTVLARQGVYNTTLQAIADEAGISKGALYYYYKSKDAILYDIMDTDLSVTTALAGRAAAESTPKDALIDDIITEFDRRLHKTERNKIHFYLALEAFLGNQELRDSYLGKYQEWTDRIEDIMAELHNLPRTQTLRAVSVMILAAIDGFCIQNLFGVELVDQQVLLDFGKVLLEGDTDIIAKMLKGDAE